MSDGHIDVSLKSAGITSKDKEWLENISSQIADSKPLYKRKKVDCYNLNIHNKEIVTWLINNGCVLRKSKILTMPENMPEKYLPHFIRGVFDGDGSISLVKQRSGKTTRLVGYIVTASKIFSDQLSCALEKMNIKNKIAVIQNKNVSIKGSIPKDYDDVYRVTFTGLDSIKFYEMIYNDKNIFLERKYEKYLQYKNIRVWELENCQIKS